MCYEPEEVVGRVGSPLLQPIKPYHSGHCGPDQSYGARAPVPDPVTPSLFQEPPQTLVARGGLLANGVVVAG